MISYEATINASSALIGITMSFIPYTVAAHACLVSLKGEDFAVSLVFMGKVCFIISQLLVG